MSQRLQKLELTWVGKEKRARLEPRVLVEKPELSHHAATRRRDGKDIFDNMLIHGDNLLALKALEQQFAGQVKCIYIDPPYNTGTAFTYYDDGLEHSIWLGLMRERLEMLYKLLSKDGSIWIQIDDNEQAYLKVLMDEVFGRQNFITTLIPVMNPRGRQESRYPLAKQHEYILVYSKTPSEAALNALHPDVPSGNVRDEYRLLGLRKAGNASLRQDRPNMWYPIYFDPTTNDISIIKSDYPVKILPVKTDGTEGRWRWKKENVELRKNELVVKRNTNNEYDVYVKDYLVKDGESKGQKLQSVIKDVNIINDKAKQHLQELFNEKQTFDFPKSEHLIQAIIEISSNVGDIVLDSFLGSGTTVAVAHKMGRRWIGVELGDHCYTHCKVRLDKVIDGDDAGGITKALGWKGGGGYRFYELAPTLITKDQWGQEVINRDYNPAMLAEAVCKLEGYIYTPSQEEYFIHGHATEKAFIYVTTNYMRKKNLAAISERLGAGCQLLICCKAFDKASAEDFDNLTVKKIPDAVLKKCEWGHDDYSLNVKNLPMAEEEQQVVQDDLF